MTLTATGFERPRLTDIKADLDARVTAVLGPVNTSPDSVTGQILGIVAASLDDVWEAAQATYDSMYPATAEGVSLDGAVSFVGLERQTAAPTTAVAMCYGAESTFVPAGSLARSVGGVQFVTDYDLIISRANAGDVEITVNTVENAGNYQIIAGGVSVTYTSDASATAAEIINGLAALFDAGTFLATVDGTTLRLRNVNLESAFSLTVGSKLTISRLGSPVAFTAAEMGATVLPIGALNYVDTAISGWDEVSNLTAGNTGREVETDEELRVRHAESVRVTGAATVPAIRARLLADVEGVEYVAIYENRTNVVDANGLPSHSFEAVVSGGSTQDVANKLFEVKPAGIQTFGNTSATVIDENGDGQLTSFSRPVPQYAWARVTINSLDTEEAVDPGYIDAIKAAVVATGNALGIGKDVIIQRFYGPIYTSTPGLGSITVEMDVTASPLDVPTYATSNIVIARGDHAIFDLARVTVVP